MENNTQKEYQEVKDKLNKISSNILPADCEWWNVESVIDWDTIVVDGKKIRLIWIDTPESVDPNKPIEPYALEASSTTKKLLLDMTVCLSVDSQSSNKDVYNRLLRYVYLADGTFVNAELIKWWYARVYNVFPFDYNEWFTELEIKARKARIWIRWL